MSGTGEITIRELITKMHDAAGKMSRKNPHRALMLHAMSAIIQMLKRTAAAEEIAADAAEKPLVELARPLVTLQ